MPGLRDPGLLQFAGQLLSKGRQGQVGFGASLGNALMGAAQGRQHQIDQQRQQQQDLMARAQASVQLRAALGQLQERQQQQAAQQQFVQSLPADQQAAAAVIPEQAAQTAFGQANPEPISPAQQASLDQNQQQFAQKQQLAQERLALEKQESAARLDALQQKIATAGQASVSDVASLRKEYTANSKDFSSVRDGYKRVLAADSTGAGDVALIFGYMKLLDPGSVVREGEFATAEQTAGVPERVRNLYNKAITGERLGEQQRQSFTDQATSLYREQFETQQQTASGFTQIASRYGIPADDIIQAVPMPSPEQLVDEQITDNAKKLNVDRALLDKAAEETGLPVSEILRALEAKRANSS